MDARSTAEVFASHLELSRARAFEDDLARNYSRDVVVLCRAGVLRGHDGMRASREELRGTLEGAEFEYTTQLVEGPWAFLEWVAPEAGVFDGADSFVVEDGLIVMQSIHYSQRRA